VANFNTHFVVGAGASAMVTATLLSMENITSKEALMAFALGTVGGLLPDIDSSRSKAIELAFTLFAMLSSIFVIFIQVGKYSLVEMFIMAGFLFILLRYGVIEIFRRVSIHRGMFHSIPAGIIWGISTVILVKHLFYIDNFIAWIYGIMVTFGYIIHLTLDEIYSVDLKNRRIKKSFGTALKLYKIDSNFAIIQTATLYIIIVYLLKKAPDSSDLWDILLNYESWERFKSILLPKEAWFFH
jgi:hypothetical protein